MKFTTHLQNTSSERRLNNSKRAYSMKSYIEIRIEEKIFSIGDFNTYQDKCKSTHGIARGGWREIIAYQWDHWDTCRACWRNSATASSRN